VSNLPTVQEALERIAADGGALNAFSEVLAPRALATARQARPGPLSGVPFAVKNLFDLRSITTRAGSLILRDDPPAAADARAVTLLEGAGAVCVGTTTMDEFAYGFTTENVHEGPARNPHDRTRIAGGSSGGSAAAVAAGFVPLSLGSDTNGSMRVPAALCGVYSIKPTYGAVSKEGMFPFVDSLDSVGAFASDLSLLATAYGVLAEVPVPSVSGEIGGLRIAVADGYFARGLHADARAAVERVALALGAERRIDVIGAERARAAAYVITACEGGTLHRERLRTRARDFDPATRERLMAGAIAPAAWYVRAQRFRRLFAQAMRELFTQCDVLLAPATPCAATPIGAATVEIDGVATPIRPNLGSFAQPLSLVGLPVLTVPVIEDGRLPLGVQLIAAPGNEAALFAAAGALAGVCAA
jgi:AtzE family amidohydrolase